MRINLDPSRGRSGRVGGWVAAGLLMGVAVLFTASNRAAADGLGLGHGGGLGIGLGGLHAGIGIGSGAKARGGGKAGDPSGARTGSGAAPAGAAHRADGLNAGGKPGVGGAPTAPDIQRGHEDGAINDLAAGADVPASAASASAPNLMSHNGNAEHVYDDIPPIEATGTVPTAFENALGAQPPSPRTSR